MGLWYNQDMYKYTPLEDAFSIGDISFTTANTVTSRLGCCPKTTELIDRFLADNYSYLLLDRSFFYSPPNYSNCFWISLICTSVGMSHPAARRKSLPSISLLKQAAIDQIDISGPLYKRLHPIAISIFKTMKQNNYQPGNYLIDEPEVFKAQQSSDRSGFRKEWRGADIVYEWNYGDCSTYFAVIGFQAW